MNGDEHQPIKIDENLLASYNIYEIFGNLLNAMSVLRRQEASLESSNGFYRGSRSSLRDEPDFAKF